MSTLTYPEPTFRRLRGYAFDPSLSTQLDTSLIDATVYSIRWEKLEPGPIGEYLEVVDYDPVGQVLYPPVDLDNPFVLAQDGLSPSEGSAQFHQQMVYAVAMTTIQNFERAMGRKIFWSYRVPVDAEGNIPKGASDEYVQRLRIYPHAMREANAYYSPDKKALLFGYFPASQADDPNQLPGGLVFTCLSHDIVAHETTHAILDGMHRRFIEPTHPDTLAFHEAFSDLVALFQHFSIREVLEHQIARTRGELQSQSLLGELAQQFGRAIGGHGSLRSAIGRVNPDTKKWELLRADPNDYRTVMEPHGRGAILVAAVFDAFLLIYQQRVSDLFRIATNGTGILQAGNIHPDLVKRLATEAAKAARHILTMCIRALDYCPPVDITFGDFLRAVVTADVDIVHNDSRDYRTAFIEAFKRRGIYPEGLRTLSAESLRYPVVDDDLEKLGPDFMAELRKIGADYRLKLETEFDHLQQRDEAFVFINKMKRFVWVRFNHLFTAKAVADAEPAQQPGQKLMRLMGLSDTVRKADKPNDLRFQIEAIRRARRTGPDGVSTNQLIITVTQWNPLNPAASDGSDTEKQPKFRGGCNLIMDLNTLTVRYIVAKDINDTARRKRQQQYMAKGGANFRTAYYLREIDQHEKEPFALLHRL